MANDVGCRDMERLDKVISNFGGLTRGEAKEYIKRGRVTVGGETVKDGSRKVNESDIIRIDGNELNCSKYRYFMLNKPEGYISSTEDDPSDGTPNVIRLFEKEGVKGLFPVGRLDKDVTGLLIVTNDGALGHDLTAPSKHVDKTYIAEVSKILNNDDIKAFENGFEFKDFKSAPAELEILKTNELSGTSEAKVRIHEGKFHQVKRMFIKVGCEVMKLKRISMGKLVLDDKLEPGKYRELSGDELSLIKDNGF